MNIRLLLHNDHYYMDEIKDIELDFKDYAIRVEEIHKDYDNVYTERIAGKLVYFGTPRKSLFYTIIGHIITDADGQQVTIRDYSVELINLTKKYTLFVTIDNEITKIEGVPL